LSAESAILLELHEVNAKLDQLAARLNAVSPTVWPERLRTVEAVLYVRQAHRLPTFCARTLSKWLAAGRLSDIASPRRWLREELDRCCCGTPASSETRGRRRAS
jgi:hypothetical protein